MLSAWSFQIARLGILKYCHYPSGQYRGNNQGQLFEGAACMKPRPQPELAIPRLPSFRWLGCALLLKGQFDEAEAAFRRVLAAMPADLSAHLGLAELYDQRRRLDQALWHAERALEADVNYRPTMDLLSALYRRYRSEERPAPRTYRGHAGADGPAQPRLPAGHCNPARLARASAGTRGSSAVTG